MTDLQSNSSASTSPPSDDPLSHLHKMSTTAGLGSTEYVAVNVMAVVAIILGLASSLSLLDATLLIIPATAIVIAFLALRQIRNSGGTQTGRGLAWLGMVLALGFVAMLGGREVLAVQRTRDDERQITDVITQLGNTLRDGKYEEAYRLYTPKFTSRIPLDRFTAIWRSVVQGTADYGGLDKIQSNGRMAFDTIPDTDQKEAAGMAIVEFKHNAPPQRLTVTFRQTPDGWRIDDVPLLFPAQPPSPPKRK